MKFVTHIPYWLILALAILTVSCEKEDDLKDRSFVCFLESETDNITRSCFQLNDGSFIIAGTGKEFSVMAKFSERGDLIWQKRLPGTVYGLQKGLPLPTGGFVLAGSDSIVNPFGTNPSGITTLLVYDKDGNQANTFTIASTPFSSMTVQLDLIRLSNGNLALCLSPIAPFSANTYPRLIILSPEFNILFDQVYYASPGVPFTMLNAPNMQEGPDGSIYISFQDINASGTLLKLNPNYSMSYYTDSIGLGSSELPSSMAIDKIGNCLIASSKQVNPGQQSFAYYHPNEYFSFGSEVSVIKTDSSGKSLERRNFSGFPPNGSLMKMIRTSDGGFAMVGTSGQAETFTIVSNTNIFLIKTDGELNLQWMHQFNTTYPSVGYDLMQTSDGGFAIGAFQRSFNMNFKMMIIKTDLKGN